MLRHWESSHVLQTGVMQEKIIAERAAILVSTRTWWAYAQLGGGRRREIGRKFHRRIDQKRRDTEWSNRARLGESRSLRPGRGSAHGGGGFNVQKLGRVMRDSRRNHGKSEQSWRELNEKNGIVALTVGKTSEPSRLHPKNEDTG